MKAFNVAARAVVTLFAVAFWSAMNGGDAQAQSSPREIVVAQVAVFSGPVGPTGRGTRAGIQLYFDHVNATGGINGAKIRFVTQDDGYRPPDTVRLVKEVIAKEKPVALIGVVGAVNLDALGKENVLVEARTPLVGGVSGASSSASLRNVFLTKAGYHDEIDRLFTIVSTIGVNRVGVVYQDDPFGLDVVAGAEKASAKTGVKIVLRSPYPRATTDVKAAVEQALKADPQLVYLGAVTSAAIEFIKEYRRRGGGAQIYGLSVIDGAAVVGKLGPALAHGFAYGTVVPPTSARRLAVVREYLELAGRSKLEDLSGRSMEGFISAKVLVHALRTAKRPTPEAVLQALQSIRGLDLGGYLINFQDPGHTGSRYVDFAILDGRGRAVQ